MKKVLAIVLSLAMVLSFTACEAAPAATNDTKAETAAEEGGEAAEASGLSGKLDIWAWGADDEAKAREGALKIFVEEHPEVDITYSIIPTADSVWDQKAAAALSSGSAGDVMQMSPDYFGMNTNYYEDLNPFVEKEGVNLDDVIVDGLMAGYYDADGKLEGFPLLANIFVMAYNKDMFAEKGVEVPADGWTLQDLCDWGTAFAGGSGADQTYGIVKHWVMNNVILYAGGGLPYADDKSEAYMDTDKVVEALTVYNDLYTKGIMPDDTAQETIPAETLFVSGKAAMYPCGGFETVTVTRDALENGIDIGFCMMPSDPDGKEINVQYATGWAMNKTCQNQDAAWQFLKEIAYENDDMNKETAVCGMPSSKKIADEFYANITFDTVGGETLDNSYYVEHMGASHINPWGGTLASSGDIWANMVSAVLSDGQDPQAVVDEFGPQINEEFSTYVFTEQK